MDDDLIVRGDPGSNLGNVFREIERPARFVNEANRASRVLRGSKACLERNVFECIVLVFLEDRVVISRNSRLRWKGLLKEAIRGSTPKSV